MLCFLIEAASLLGVCYEGVEVSWVYCEQYKNKSINNTFKITNEYRNISFTGMTEQKCFPLRE